MSKEIDEARRKELRALAAEMDEREEQIYQSLGLDPDNPKGFDGLYTDEIKELRREEALRYKAILEKYSDN